MRLRYVLPTLLVVVVAAVSFISLCRLYMFIETDNSLIKNWLQKDKNSETNTLP